MANGQLQPTGTLEQILGLTPRTEPTPVVEGAGSGAVTAEPVVEDVAPTDLNQFEMQEPGTPQITIDSPAGQAEAFTGPVVEDVGPDTTGFRADEFVGDPVKGSDLGQPLMLPLLLLQLQQEKHQRYTQYLQSIQAAIPEFDRFDDSDTWGDGVGGWMVMADLTRNPELHNKQKKFQEHYPLGSLIQVQSSIGPVLLARSEPGQPYRTLPISPRIAGAVVSEQALLGAAGSIPAGPLGVIGAGAGTAAGVAVQAEIEEARGYTSDGYYGDMAIQGGLAATVDALSRGVGRMVFGKTRTQFEADALEGAMQASKDLNLVPLTTGQTGGFFTRKLFHQVGQTADVIQEKVTAQQRSLLDGFKKKGAINDAEPDEVLNEILNAQHAELAGMLNFQALSRSDAGQALADGVKWYRQASRTMRDRLYERAITEADDVTFNISNVQAVARSIQMGVRARGQQQRDALGHFTTADLVQLAEQPEGKLAKSIDTILALQPKLKKVMTETPDGNMEWNAFEQIKALRTRLFDLKNSDQPDVRREASRLWMALTESMDSPVSGSPNFTRAYKMASGFNRLRETTLEYTSVAQALKSDTPGQLAGKYFRPGRTKELEAIKAIIPDAKWNEFRSGYMFDLASLPNSNVALNRLKVFQAQDAAGLEMLMSKTEQKDLTEFLIRKAQFDSSPAAKIMARDMSRADKFVAFAKEGQAGEISQAVRLAGGIDSEYARLARAGVYQDILSRSTSLNTQGVEIIDPRLMSDAIQEWVKSGKLKSFMTQTDLAKLANINAYGRIIGDTGDVGGGMMGGAIRQQTAELPAHILQGRMGAVRSLAQKLIANRTFAWMLTRNVRFGRVRGQRGLPFRELAVNLGVASNIVRESERGE